MFETDYPAMKRLASLSRAEIGESEEDVKVNFAVALLEALGHSRLRFEHKRKDILLREGLPRGASVVVETKRYGEPLDRHLPQLDRLALEERCLLAVITNGAELRVYAPMQTWARGIAETLVLTVRREELTGVHEIAHLAYLMGPRALETGGTLREIAEAFEDQAFRQRCEEHALNTAQARREALQARLHEVEGRLAELARERVVIEGELEAMAKQRGKEPLLQEGFLPPSPHLPENSQPPRSGEPWTDEELTRAAGPYQMRILGAFVAAGRRRLTLKELTRAAGLSPQATWGALSAFTLPAKKGGKEPFLEVDKGPSHPVRARGAAVEIREKYWGAVVRLCGG